MDNQRLLKFPTIKKMLLFCFHFCSLAVVLCWFTKLLRRLHSSDCIFVTCWMLKILCFVTWVKVLMCGWDFMQKEVYKNETQKKIGKDLGNFRCRRAFLVCMHGNFWNFHSNPSSLLLFHFGPE